MPQGSNGPQSEAPALRPTSLFEPSQIWLWYWGSHARPPREEDLVAPGWCLPSFVPQNRDFCSRPICVCFLGYDLYRTIPKWAQLGTSFPGILAYSHFSLLYLLYFSSILKKNGRFVFVWFWGLTGTSCMLSIHYHWAVHPKIILNTTILTKVQITIFLATAADICINTELSDGANRWLKANPLGPTINYPLAGCVPT